MIAIGDTVMTKLKLFFVDIRNPSTGDESETYLPKKHALKVCGIDKHTVDVELPDGYVATLDIEDVELI